MNPYLDAENFTDEQLMYAYVEGDNMAFEALYYRHNEKVYNYIAKRLDNPQNCDEVFQRTFIKLHRFRDKYDSRHIFLKWLYTIARSELQDFLKKKRIETVFLEPDSFSSNIDKTDTEEMKELSSLSEKEQQAINLRFYEDEEYREISKKLNTSESNARKIISRAIGKLRKQLGVIKND